MQRQDVRFVDIDVVGWSIHVRRINETQHLREISGG
jgi:hypothetical protein